MEAAKGYDRPVQVADGIYWVGYRDVRSNLTCNPYLVVEEEQAVLIDGGSRADFAAVMMKILQAGVDPRQVVALVYQHYDPDLCGSMSNFLDMCENPDLRVISEERNNAFISFYISRDKYRLLDTIQTYDFRFSLGGRMLRFVRTPYCHNPGSFVTYDTRTHTLFSGDLFGSYATRWDLFLSLAEHCYACQDYDNCPKGRQDCPVRDILAFHREIMPSNKALRFAVSRIRELAVDLVAPQHGSLLRRPEDIAFVLDKLENLESVGIDGVV